MMAAEVLYSGAPAKPSTLGSSSARVKRPDIFLVGAPKSGTTALDQYLASHPDIFMAKKELHFFGSDLQFGPQFYRRNLPGYLAEYSGRNGHRHAGESSVWYLFSRRAAAEIREFNPEARIIIMLREPTEMLYSLYYQFRYQANEQLPSFAAALAAEPDRRVGRQIPRQASFALGLVYRDVARYTEQVRRYFEVFGREQVKVVIYDDFAADPAAVYRGILEFVGADTRHRPDEFNVINGNKTARSAAVQALLSEPWVRMVAHRLARRLPRRCYNLFYHTEQWLWRLNSTPFQRPRLEPELQAQLKREFEPEVERLSQLLGRDLTPWSQRRGEKACR